MPERKSKSPNLRVKDDTKSGIRRRQEWVMEQLGVGVRKVSADILIAAMDQVNDRHPDELLVAIRAEWVRRGL